MSISLRYRKIRIQQVKIHKDHLAKQILLKWPQNHTNRVDKIIQVSICARADTARLSRCTVTKIKFLKP